MPGSRLIALAVALVLAATASVIVASRDAGSLRAGVLANAKASASNPRSFPLGRNLVTAAEVRQAGAGTPQGALLEWTRAVQQRDVRTVEQLTSSKAAVAPATLAAAVRTVGSLLAYPQVINQLAAKTTASLAVNLLAYTTNRAAPALSLSAIYAMDREHGGWRVRSTSLLLKNAADLNRRRRP